MWRKRSSKAQRVVEEPDSEPDRLHPLPEEMHLRILECLDHPREAVSLALASPRLGWNGRLAALERLASLFERNTNSTSGPASS